MEYLYYTTDDTAENITKDLNLAAEDGNWRVHTIQHRGKDGVAILLQREAQGVRYA